MNNATGLKTLVKLLREANQAPAGVVTPAPEMENLGGIDRELAHEILGLLEKHNVVNEKYRHFHAQLLADAEILTEALGHIGLGNFSTSVAEVKLPGLRTVSIGIEDMAHSLKKARDELDSMINRLRESEEKFKNLVESTSDWIWEVDQKGVYTYSSPQVESLLGYKPEEMLGRTPFELMPESEAAAISTAFAKSMRANEPINRLENTCIHKNGQKVILETSGVPFFNDAGVCIGYRGVDRDITARKHMEEGLRYEASHDPLTGLYNRREFGRRLAEEIYRAERYDRGLSLLLADIDYFKSVNDTYGHGVGDHVLKDLAAVMEKFLRKTDFIARYGGEEFIAILPETDPAVAEDLAERLRVHVAEHKFVEDHHLKLNIRISIGVASFPEHARTLQELLNKADSAMYAAKAAGRNQVKTAV